MSDPPDESIESFVLRVAAEVAPADAPAPILGARMADLEMDSLACADLAVAIEDRFGARLGDGGLTSESRLQDVVGFVRSAPRSGDRLPAALGSAQPAVAALIGPAMRAYLRLEVVGREHVPPAGPAIMAANHASAWDIPIHVIAGGRPIVFMAKEEIYRRPMASGLWHVLGGFSVSRGTADLRAIDRAVRTVRLGKLVGIYPEGTRVRGGRLGQFLPGAAWLALLTGAPIVPAGLSGTDRRGAARGSVRAAFGPPIVVDAEPDPVLRRKKAAELTDELREAIESLLV